jgi:hypothetical protein
MSATATGRSNGRRRNGRPPLIEREWDVYVCPDPECGRIVQAGKNTKGPLPCTSAYHRNKGTYPKMVRRRARVQAEEKRGAVAGL